RLGHFLTDRLSLLILWRIVAILGVLEGWELDHHVAAPSFAFQRLVMAAPGEEFCAVTLEGGLCRGDVILVALGIAHIHMSNPVGFGHFLFPFRSTVGGHHLLENGLGGSLAVSRANDGPGHDKMACARADGIARRDDP